MMKRDQCDKCILLFIKLDLKKETRRYMCRGHLRTKFVNDLSSSEQVQELVLFLKFRKHLCHLPAEVDFQDFFS